ncbi:membrane-associated protease RseP (regulator of RpoE activity) [Streptosporangium becharense]|uniref:Membrane-associated protease RseP (Regulator of RpoE activity) n=1 Tax=Streptosporangium becharense TaxID=1816182 RepID=A0A7W9MIY9_9ACTN|nr:site-2 protease family protein [Streptosporangium becharense]MBB2910913.1 membrane-associated protease RseP (regulator of RpoE activity) [Streptosporangium becharense]MBB5822028.1 membrane-associated protease RseP (regulator of RpoE activity) [Streptosporangium becharense]
MIWPYVIGIVIFLVGLMLSIALHEIGHLVPAKRFGVKVTQYMVGFGPTMWSRRKGETEYGIKWLPLGGYIRMIGMLPPRPSDAPGTLRSVSTGPWQGLIDSAREVALEEVRPGDEDRVFYRKPWWQKVIIMSGGPAMNFLLAFILFGVVLMGFGIQVQKNEIASIPQCVKTAADYVKNPECTAADRPSPASAAGLRPGDVILSVGGKPTATWEAASRAIRANGAGPVEIGVRRAGQDITLNATLIAQDRESLDEPGKIEKGVGYLGVSPTTVIERQSFGAVVEHMGDLTSATAASLLRFPEKMVGVWNAAFSGDERDKNGPIGVIGVSRIGGEIAASAAPLENKIVIFINLLAGFNLAIGLFNLLPLLPLDGGHVAGGLWEGLKRGFARVTRRPTPGHVDIAKALPLTYAIAFVMIIMAGLLMYADLVNPVRLSG